MPDVNDDYYHAENIKIFTLKLRNETDPKVRKMLLQLLAEETGWTETHLPKSI